MMRIKIVFILISVFFLPAAGVCQDAELTEIRRQSTKNTEKVYLYFNTIAPYRLIKKGKRIDLVFDQTISFSRPLNLEPDEKIVKFLAQQQLAGKQSGSVFSFFLRYVPVDVMITQIENNTLVLDIQTGNQFTATYPELSSKLHGLEVIEQEGTGLDNPLKVNPYRGAWHLFFSNYETEVETHAPFVYSLPPFPIISQLGYNNHLDILPSEVYEKMKSERWEEITDIVYSAIAPDSDVEQQKMMVLTLGELLFRSGDFENAYKQLYLLQEKYKEEPVAIAAKYLIAHIRGKRDENYLANTLFKELNQYVSPHFPLSSYIVISQIESSLITDQLERTWDILQSNTTGYTPRLANIVKLRRADYWYANKNRVKAHVSYTLLPDKNILQKHPYSLNNYCSTLYSLKKYKEASDCFQTLEEQIIDDNLLGEISVKKALAQYRFKKPRQMYTAFSTLEDTYQQTPPGLIAAIKKTDIRYLTQPDWKRESAVQYHTLAEVASQRALSEEAALKEAIVYSELGEYQTSIDLLMHYLRFYHKGNLLFYAQALLVEILPKTLKAYLDEGKYLKALVLAKKNRELFQKNWIDISLLADLAKAYHELYIFEEAKNLYLYLLANTTKEEREKYYRSILDILYSMEDYDLMEKYISEYFYNYPDGDDYQYIAAMRIKSLLARNRTEEAKKLFATIAKENKDLHKKAAVVYFAESNYKKAIEHLEPFFAVDELKDANYQFLLAESYFKTGDYQTSLDIYKRIKTAAPFTDQVVYRIASIKKQDGLHDEALKLFAEIVEKGTSTTWKKLAQKELDYAELETKQ